VIESPRFESLANSIYILAAHSALAILRPLVDFVTSNLPSDLKSDDKEIVLLAVRLAALMVDRGQIQLPAAPPSFAISRDFMSFVPKDWFVRPDVNHQNARALVSMSVSVNSDGFAFDLETILPILVAHLSQFIENPVRLNLALTEFCAALAAKCGNEATFFAFGSECEGGLCKVLREVCGTVERRIGQKPVTIQEIKDAYEALDARNPDTESDLFLNVVLLLEFLKELHAIGKTKNLLRQRESMFVG
jgi:hypothetical protein